MCVIVFVSSVVFASVAADTVTVCAVLQLVVVKVSDEGVNVMSLSPVAVSATVTSPVGTTLNATV